MFIIEYYAVRTMGRKALLGLATVDIAGLSRHLVVLRSQKCNYMESLSQLK